MDIARVQPQDIKVGDIVTLKSPGGTVYTHRINRIVQLSDGMYIETIGDAVGQPDTPLQPASEVAGRVTYSLPYLGLLMYMLTIPTGVLSIFCLALTMLLCIWLLEEMETEDRDGEPEDYECELARILDAARMSELIG